MTTTEVLLQRVQEQADAAFTNFGDLKTLHLERDFL